MPKNSFFRILNIVDILKWNETEKGGGVPYYLPTKEE